MGTEKAAKNKINIRQARKYVRKPQSKAPHQGKTGSHAEGELAVDVDMKNVVATSTEQKDENTED